MKITDGELRELERLATEAITEAESNDSEYRGPKAWAFVNYANPWRIKALIAKARGRA